MNLRMKLNAFARRTVKSPRPPNRRNACQVSTLGSIPVLPDAVTLPQSARHSLVLRTSIVKRNAYYACNARLTCIASYGRYDVSLIRNVYSEQLLGVVLVWGLIVDVIACQRLVMMKPGTLI